MPDFGHARPRSGGRHSLPAALALLLASVVGVVAPNPRDPRLLNPIVQDSVFVKWRQSSATAGSATLAAAAGAGDVVKLASGGAVSAAPVRPSEQPANTVARLKNLPGVEAIGYDFWVHAQSSSEQPSFPYMAPYTDTYWNESWGMHRISAGYAWGRGVAGRKGDGAPRVCLIDSGVDCDHPDLKDVCVAGKSFLTDGRRTTQRSGLKAVRDESGHGTMMAGLIAATKNHMGSVGALYNGVSLHVCKFMDANGFGRMIDARLCLDWCLKQRTHISVAAWGVNIYGMKWRCNDTLAAELRRRGNSAEAEEWRCDDPASALLWEFKSQLEGAAGWHVMVAAAGNDGRRLLADCPGYVWMPSQMRASNMLVVTASDYYDRLWRAGGAGPPQHATCDAMRQGTPAGGNYGADWVHIAAPGQDVWTTRMRTKEELKDKKLRGRGTYLQVSGTSAAAALVAGGLGLFQVATGNDASDLMAEMLLEGADAAPQLAADAGDGGGPPVAGGRRLNVYNPLVAVAELFGDQSWQWLPPQLCGLAPESTLPPLTAQPPPSDPSGVGNLNKGPNVPPPPPTPPPPPEPRPPPPKPRPPPPAKPPPPPPKPRPPPPLPKPSPPSPKPRPPPPLPKPSPPPPKPRPPPPKPRPSPPPPKPRPPPPKPRPPPPKPRPPPPQAVPRPPKPAPRPPPPGCQATYYWNGRACVACASRWGSNCALCTGSRCTLSCPPSARSRLPCSQYYPAPARRG